MSDYDYILVFVTLDLMCYSSYLVIEYYDCYIDDVIVMYRVDYRLQRLCLCAS